MTIAVTAILTGQADDRRRQSFLIIEDNPPTPLRRTRLSQIPARPALRETELLTNMDDTSFAALGAYQFPSVASLRTSFSSVRSATARRRRVFSRSSSFRRRAWSTFRPPYLPTPTIVTLFRYSDMPAYLANRLALRQENLCFTEVTNDLLD